MGSTSLRTGTGSSYADDAFSNESAAVIVGDLLATVERQRLLPDATYGKWVKVRERRAGALGAQATNNLRREVTAALTRKFDAFLGQHPDLTQVEGANAFLRLLPLDVRPRSRSGGPMSGSSLLRRLRRGRRETQKK